MTFGSVADAIKDAYSKIPAFTLKARPPAFVQQATLSLTAQGLGDVTVLTDILRGADEAKRFVGVWSTAPTFQPVMNYCPYFHQTPGCPPGSLWMVDALRLINEHDCGNGHITQQLRRAYRLPVDRLPKGQLACPSVKRRANRVIMHFEPAASSAKMQEVLHPRPRYIAPQHIPAIAAFVSNHPELEFFEVGMRPLGVAGTTFVPTPTLPGLIELIASANLFVGIMSGPLNIATALGIRCVVIVNIPKVERLVLPVLRRTYVAEEEWQYPQNVHLHQDGASKLVPALSEYTLEAALNGEVYPFWSDAWLDLPLEIPYA